MSSVSRLNGFTPVKHTNGSPYNGQVNTYFTSTGDSSVIMVGDLVKLQGNGRAASGVPTITRCAAGDIPVGVVVGMGFTGVGDAQNIPPVTVLDVPGATYRAASTNRYILVADAPDLVLQAQLLTATTFSTADIGLNVSYDTAAGNTASGSSGMSVDMSTVTTTNTIPLKLVGFPNTPNNVLGDTYLNVYVEFNTHSKKSATGTTGI